MLRLNGLDEPQSNGHIDEENKSISVSKDLESNGKSVVKTADLESIPTVYIHLNPDRLVLAKQIGEAPGYNIMEASDPFMNPKLYQRYSICTDIEDTFPERLAKHIENIKDVTRDRAVTSITAGENTVYWLVNTFKYLTNGWFGLLILLLTVIIYGSLGAFIFMVLEGPAEEKIDKQIIDIRRGLTKTIENIVKNNTVNMTNPDFYALLEDFIIEYENDYTELRNNVHNNNVTENTWNFANSFIFAGTIITTIGYGHITPKTVAGRAATIVYAIIGIPLFLIALTSFGKFLTRIIKFFWKCIFCSKRFSAKDKKMHHTDVYRPTKTEDIGRNSSHEEQSCGKPEIESIIEVDEEFNLPISLALSILILYMLIGTILAHYLESQLKKWTFFEAFYCVFISMSTIGLGDFVLSDSMCMIYSIVYIIFGLSLTAMCIDVVQKNMTVMFKHACLKVMILVNEAENNLNDLQLKNEVYV